MAGYIRFPDGILGEVQTQSRASLIEQGFTVPENFKDYTGWIRTTGVSQTVNRPIQTGRSGSVRQRTAVVVEDFNIQKEMDKASPQLAAAAVAGQAWGRVDIDLCMSLSGLSRNCPPITVAYMEIVLLHVRITSYTFEMQGTNTGDIPTETLNLNFDKIHWTYHPYGAQTILGDDGPTVSPASPSDASGPIARGWDVAMCKPYTMDAAPWSWG